MIALTFDERVYALEAVQKAAYRYTHLFGIELKLRGEYIDCALSPISEMSEEAIAKHIKDFNNEVLDQHLRLKIKRETEDVRNLILGIAFSRTGLIAVE